MSWWAWLLLAAALGSGLDLLVQWGRARLGQPLHDPALSACPACGELVPLATWRCYSCRTWIRRRRMGMILGVLQVPAFVGGFVLMAAAVILWGALWLLLKATGPLAGRPPLRSVVKGMATAWRVLFGYSGRGSTRAGRRTLWWTGGDRVMRYLIPVDAGSPGARTGDLLEKAIGGREVPGAWRGAVVWVKEPDAVVGSAFLAGTHLTEVGATRTWADRGTFHRVELAPVREWVGFRGTRPDLEALGDLYLSIAGGIGLVAVGTGADRPPTAWGAGSGESPSAWVGLDSTHGGTGWEVDLHWNLWYEPAEVPADVAVSRAPR